MTNLSNTFKYISHFRHEGHQIGRKIGDMLELLTYGALFSNINLKTRLIIEPKLHGISGAGHKVEFVLNKEVNPNNAIVNGGSLEDISNLIGFIECKKVGVEQTINSSFKKNYTKVGNKRYRINFNEPLSVAFRPRNEEASIYSTVITQNELTVTKNEDVLLQENLTPGHRIIFTLGVNGETNVLGNDESLRDIDYDLKNCRILEIERINNDHVEGILNDCLAGPQTPEKAKQSSFVALDVRKHRFGQFDMRENEEDFISVLVLTEFSHWEEKSRNMIRTCIDKNFVIDDEIIVVAFEKFEEEFGNNFYSYITKENFERNPRVQELILQIINDNQGLIFRDIEDNIYKKISFENEKLIFIS